MKVMREIKDIIIKGMELLSNGESLRILGREILNGEMAIFIIVILIIVLAFIILFQIYKKRKIAKI